jgi:serine protease Do
VTLLAFSTAATAQLPDFTELVEKQGPAVVNISTVQTPSAAGNRAFPGMPNIPEDDPFFDFFRRYMPPHGAPRDFESKSLGSGFIISSDGYILTNTHLVDTADEINVKLTDKREFRAKLIGADRKTDIALLKIDATGLPKVTQGDPGKLKVGEWVVAIGSPFGFENSVTAGIVSAKGRSLAQENFVPFIQTDVAINPGNSGGPLFNLKGEVVGINSQIYSRTGGYMGLSFAVPINVANDVREQLVKYGKVTRSRIGVSIQDVTAQLAESFGLDRPRGALVGMVEDGGPGEKGGIKAGDVILSVDGTQIDTSSQVPGLIANKKPGSTVNLEVWRDGSTKKLSVRPEEIKDKGERVASNDDANKDETDKLGLAVRPLQPEEKREANTQGSLVVENVEGPAQEAGVQPGDIILGVNGKPVKTLDDLRSAAKKRNGKVVALLIERENSQIFLPVRIG